MKTRGAFALIAPVLGIVWLCTFGSDNAEAANRWNRAKGPVTVLFDNAKSIEKRLDYLECHGYSHQIAHSLVHAVGEVKEALYADADAWRLEASLHEVQSLNRRLIEVVQSRHSLHEDSRLRHDIERFQDRISVLEREVRKCVLASKPACPMEEHYPSPSVPSRRGFEFRLQIPAPPTSHYRPSVEVLPPWRMEPSIAL
ncbi:MAG: hypothetical protein U0905_04635 [Pirellulales bacterium]